MQLGMIGLGRMGTGLTQRLLASGHACVGYDRGTDAVATLEAAGGTGAESVEDLVAKLERPRHVWIMLPSAAVATTIGELADLLDPDDVVIDGGNSRWSDDLGHAATLAPRGLHFVDVGTSGGVFGLERGFCLMIGGEHEIVERLAPVFEALAPGADSAPPTPQRNDARSTAERGWLHCGPVGSGHFVKMVHNGIEYGMMAAIAEGLGVLASAGNGAHPPAEASAETTPLRRPEWYRYDIDVAEVAEVWRRGSVISSWLVDLTAGALAKSPDLAGFSGRVSDSGEGRWTIEAAVDLGVPVPVIAGALWDRFSSRGEGDFAHRVLSAMRSEFGGHAELGRPKG